jgi:cell division transport system ATP-binding protein
LTPIILKEQDQVVHLQQVNIYQEDNTLVLSDVDFSLEKGEFIYLIGQTGSGKSSLLKTIFADLPLQSGKGSVAGFELPLKPNRTPELRRKLGVIFQDFQLLPDRTVYENLLFVLKATGWKDKMEMRNRISEVLMTVGVEFASGKMPHQISGGEQQRVAIARSLLNNPVLLIADEPTGNLDPETGHGIMETFMKINKFGTAVILATHNLQWISTFPAPTLHCKNGRLLDSRSQPL